MAGGSPGLDEIHRSCVQTDDKNLHKLQPGAKASCLLFRTDTFERSSQDACAPRLIAYLMYPSARSRSRSSASSDEL